MMRVSTADRMTRMLRRSSTRTMEVNLGVLSYLINVKREPTEQMFLLVFRAGSFF
jgi:hypothetical protein